MKYFSKTLENQPWHSQPSYRFFDIQVCKTLNNLKSAFMKDMFKLRKTSRLVCYRYLMNIYIPRTNQVTFETMSRRSYRPNIWNTLSFYITCSQNIQVFRKIIKN